MAFDRVIGQGRVKQILSASMERNRLAHAYLLYGQPGIGKDAIAISMAMGMNCLNNIIGGCGQCSSCIRILRLEHSGFRLVVPVPTRPRIMKEAAYHEILRERAIRLIENSYLEINYSPEMTTIPIIGIDQIRAIKQDLALKLLEGKYRVILISHADSMTTAAANSLLKLLEEPPENTLFFLTTTVPSRLLQTIISRCQMIRLDLLKEEEIEAALIRQEGLNQIQSHFLAHIAGGSYRRALILVDTGFDEKRDAAQSFLEWSLKQDPLARIDFTDSFLNRWDKVEIIDIFEILMIWLWDVMQVKIGYSGHLMNSDRSSEIEQFENKWTNFNAEMAFFSVERAIDFIEKNVYLPLVVFQLSQDFEKCTR